MTRVGGWTWMVFWKDVPGLYHVLGFVKQVRELCELFTGGPQNGDGGNSLVKVLACILWEILLSFMYRVVD